MSQYTFHPQFIQEVANAFDVPSMVKVIRKYGSHYYKSAKMGGKLVQVTAMDSSYSNKKR